MGFCLRIVVVWHCLCIVGTCRQLCLSILHHLASPTTLIRSHFMLTYRWELCSELCSEDAH
ncbi:hypothetical protein M758_9G061400 [Ceratodon purpureus]|uniref:Uncharacterized protein n=1 Tax=Ceratodon purpureus TaxID=3225 RepID=A0A8T0GTE4_CERPU|nr:hypothetical protein KC19_9G080600 [Ceratodon purpureus]KAG0605462.1 hypothetical protein M758_9G061400 [Ceratodon purpureus]